MNPQANSSKKQVDAEIFNKFSHIINENDRKIIYDTHILASRIQSNEVKKKLRAIQDAEKFILKPQD